MGLLGEMMNEKGCYLQNWNFIVDYHLEVHGSLSSSLSLSLCLFFSLSLSLARFSGRDRDTHISFALNEDMSRASCRSRTAHMFSISGFSAASARLSRSLH